MIALSPHAPLARFPRPRAPSTLSAREFSPQIFSSWPPLFLRFSACVFANVLTISFAQTNHRYFAAFF